MGEQVKRPLSRAEVNGENVLKAMKKKPGNCEFFEKLFPHIIHNPLMTYRGLDGGNINLAMNYLEKLKKIHRPHCKRKTPHSISIR